MSDCCFTTRSRGFSSEVDYSVCLDVVLPRYTNYCISYGLKSQNLRLFRKEHFHSWAQNKGANWKGHLGPSVPSGKLVITNAEFPT